MKFIESTEDDRPRRFLFNQLCYAQSYTPPKILPGAALDIHLDGLVEKIVKSIENDDDETKTLELMNNHPNFDTNYIEIISGNTLVSLAASYDRPLVVEHLLERCVFFFVCLFVCLSVSYFFFCLQIFLCFGTGAPIPPSGSPDPHMTHSTAALGSETITLIRMMMICRKPASQ
jgi:hypothetical protein